MKTVEQFVNEQPAERSISFDQISVSDSDCGCVLIHYAREVLGMHGRIQAGYYSMENESGSVNAPDREYSIKMVGTGVHKQPTTYGKLRNLLAK